MCKNRIFGPSIISLIAVFFCLIAVRVEQAAQQDQQPDKSTNKTSNPQTTDPQSSDPQPSGGGVPARWPIFLPKNPRSSGAQSSGGGAPEQKQESKTTPTPPPSPATSSTT